MADDIDLFFSYLVKIEKIDNKIRELQNESLIFFSKYKEFYKKQIEALKLEKKRLLKEIEK